MSQPRQITVHRAVAFGLQRSITVDGDSSTFSASRPSRSAAWTVRRAGAELGSTTSVRAIEHLIRRSA